MGRAKKFGLTAVVVAFYAFLAVGSSDTSSTSGSYNGSSYDAGGTDRLTAADFEVVSWNWRKDPDFAGDGAIIYTAEVRNNSNRHVDNVRVKITTYNAQGEIVTSDYTYVSGLSPGGTSSTQGYATYYGSEEKAQIQLEP